MEQKKKFPSQAVIPFFTAVVALVFIVMGLKDYGFWTNQPTPGFFPIIIAAVLLIASVFSLVQTLRNKDYKEIKYNIHELMVILGAAGIILCTFLIGLVPSCLIYIFIWLKFVEHTPWKNILIIEAVMAVIIIGVFVVWLQVRFPLGLLDIVL